MVTATITEEQSKFCVAVGPATLTAGWLKMLAAKLSRPSG